MKLIDLPQAHEGMRQRIRWDTKHLAPPTKKSWYGTNGKRWAGRGRKHPHRNWKTHRLYQWQRPQCKPEASCD